MVPNARGLALAVRQHLETMLSNLPAPDSTVEPSGCMKPKDKGPNPTSKRLRIPTMLRSEPGFYEHCPVR